MLSFFLIVLAGVLLSVAGIVFVEVGQRRIPIQYSQRGAGKAGDAAADESLAIKGKFCKCNSAYFLLRVY